MRNSILVALDGPRLEGLELVIAGLLPGVDGYQLPDTGVSAPSLCISSDEPIAVGDEVQLCDSENTPLASIRIERLAQGDHNHTWIAGPVQALRAPEHGPARDVRLTGRTDLSTSTVAVFSPGATPADGLLAVQGSGQGPLALVAEGVPDHAQSTKLVSELRDVAELIPNSSVFFLPPVDFGGSEMDAMAAVLSGRGASAFLDLRRASAVRERGAVLLFTGLSGSGKSTIARALTDHLGARSSCRAVLLDGDHVRQELASELGFSAQDRHKNLLRQAWVGARVAEAGGVAICAPIAPFAASRAQMRLKVEPASRFFIVYVSTPLSVAEARDRKGLYAKARAGLISDFTGIGSPYEVPDDADLVIDASMLSVGECVDQVVTLLTRHRVI